MMKIRWLLVFIAVPVILVGCATAPIATSLTAIRENPDEFRNKEVEFTAPVLQNPPPMGSTYVTWNFTLGSSETGILRVSKAGYNPSTIHKAYILVEEAQQEGQPVTITGRLRVGPYRALRSGMEIDLDTVGYDGTEVDTDRGPYIGGYYPYYYPPPFFYDYPFYPYGFGAFGGFGDFDNYNGFRGFDEEEEEGE